MSYESLPNQVQGMLYVSWYDLGALGKAIKAARKINFSVTEHRQQTLERFANLEDECPFSQTERFPEPGVYVCESWGDWARKFQQLKAALSYRDSEKDPKAKSNGDKDMDYNDAQQAFWNATTAMYDQVTRSDGVWSRRTFESYYALRWRAGGAGGGGAGGGGGGGAGGGAP